MIPENNRFDRTVLFVLISLEALLFSSFYLREVAWYPPDNFDQASYLLETYRLQERIFSQGLDQVWSSFWSKGHASGVLFPIEGALAGIVINGTRFPQLCVLFLGFCALQIVAFTTARAVWKGRVYGYIALGLILSEITLWFAPGGGLFDFRMDFLAYCLYGVWVCAAIRSQLFLHRNWSLGCGLIGTFLVLNRFVAAIYLVGVSAGFALVCGIIAWFWRTDAELAARTRRRLCNLGLSTGILALLAVPILIHNWKAIHAYYVMGHAVGEEKDVRAAVLGIHDLAGHLSYYPNSIAQDHLGDIFFWGSLVAISGGLVARLLAGWRHSPANRDPHRDETSLLQILFLFGAVLCPIVVLTADISKSPVVGSIVGGAAALLVVAVTAAFAPRVRKLNSSPGGRILALCALVIFSLGVFNQLSQASRHWPAYTQRNDLKRLAELDQCLVDLADQHGWISPGVSYDVITGWLNAGSPTISAFEQSRDLIAFHPMLANGIMGVDREEALSLLKKSDFVILTTLPKVGTYPFYHHIAEYWEDLKAWADNNMVVARVVPFSTFTATVYVRPTAMISGLLDGWITSRGLLIEAARSALERFPMIRLAGPADDSRLLKIPALEATIDADKGSQTAPVSFHRLGRDYEIVIDTSSLQFPETDQVYIRLSFDSSSVPKAKEPGSDAGELVIKGPSLVELFRK
jgi:hypothetical protein